MSQLRVLPFTPQVSFRSRDSGCVFGVPNVQGPRTKRSYTVRIQTKQTKTSLLTKTGNTIGDVSSQSWKTVLHPDHFFKD